MAETIGCPECTRKLLVPEDLLGSQVKCPTCGATFTAELNAPAPPLLPLRVVEEEPPRRRTEESDQRPSEPRRRRWDHEDRDDDEDYRPRRRFRRDWEPHRGAMILILGILGIVMCQLFSPVAWIMGSQDLAAMRAGRMDPEGEGTTRAGQILGIIGTILLVVCVLGMCLIFAAAMADNGKF
jgi:hypothetical protein